MTDYIRGKKAYTKWDVDTDNVDLDLNSDGHQHLHHKPKVIHPSCFSGTKGKILKVLFVAAVFLIGLIIGYMVRRGVHEVLHDTVNSCMDDPGLYMYHEYNGRIFKNLVNKSFLAENIKLFSSQVHRAGTQENVDFVFRIRDNWKSFGLKRVRIEKFSALLSVPSESNVVEVLDSNNQSIYKVTLNESITIPYFAYSPNDTANAKPVFANFGRPEDFEYLISQGISINGTILIMKNGFLHRGQKVKRASELGAVGVLLYSEPTNHSKEFSSGSAADVIVPEDAITVGGLKFVPGDPQTPFTPSLDGMHRLPIASLDLPAIPAQPISYKDALELLRNMAGPDAPKDWQGNSETSINLGPGYQNSSGKENILLSVKNQLISKDIFNVIGTIPGEFEPGRYIIVGCHHDSWTSGASDPNSGLAILMELSRIFGEMYKGSQWKPGRSLIFATWNAEEFGIIGSTEWIQAHSKELLHRAVAYINLDVAITGNYTLMAWGSPLLRQALKEATSEVSCHEDGHEDMKVYDMWSRRRPIDKNIITQQPEISILGSGSDFVGFSAGLGISSLHLQFVDKKYLDDYPLYHTKYDLFDTMASRVDPNFTAASTLTQVLGVLIMKLTDNLHLPMKAEDYGNQVVKDTNVFVNRFNETLQQRNISLGLLDKSAQSFKNACHIFNDNYEIVNRNNLLLALRQYNDRLIELERAMLLPPAVLSDQPFFRHTLYGPNSSNVYQGIPFPHLHGAIEKAQKEQSFESWETVKEQLSLVIYALRSAEGVLNNQVLLMKEEL